ncbi:hypothetical protein NEOLI_003524 [Neolecta irregularis DAH-3]|uniref:Uncharacterized protein n=1 Tax=Neolecta irregularis (strain DAH-3) TaxID=1198029 RepID=A0A1U7LK00_NEOID|nr:hypothetical protein NEOLI_003524 [Neolecta irregularis DAH-3]|eukprot:OLL22958.1 hypothetical protein NEOLI_003524 [Neolecta irregularis DAH-3]
MDINGDSYNNYDKCKWNIPRILTIENRESVMMAIVVMGIDRVSTLTISFDVTVKQIKRNKRISQVQRPAGN